MKISKYKLACSMLATLLLTPMIASAGHDSYKKDRGERRSYREHRGNRGNRGNRENRQSEDMDWMDKAMSKDLKKTSTQKDAYVLVSGERVYYDYDQAGKAHYYKIRNGRKQNLPPRWKPYRWVNGQLKTFQPAPYFRIDGKLTFYEYRGGRYVYFRYVSGRRVNLSSNWAPTYRKRGLTYKYSPVSQYEYQCWKRNPGIRSYSPKSQIRQMSEYRRRKILRRYYYRALREERRDVKRKARRKARRKAYRMIRRGAHPSSVRYAYRNKLRRSYRRLMSKAKRRARRVALEKLSRRMRRYI